MLLLSRQGPVAVLKAHREDYWNPRFSSSSTIGRLAPHIYSTPYQLTREVC